MIVTIYGVQAYQVPIVNPRWPPKIQDGHHEIFLTFQHQTAVISRASSKIPFYSYFYVLDKLNKENERVLYPYMSIEV